MNQKIAISILFLLFVNIQISKAHEIDDLTQIFLNNLIEDSRDIEDLKLTSELKNEIDRKIESFLETIQQIGKDERTVPSESKKRVRRSLDDLSVEDKCKYFY